MPRALAIIHQPDAGPGVFTAAVQAADGWELEQWPVTEDGDPPAQLRCYDAVMSLGGAAHPDQVHQLPWMAREQVLLGQGLDAQVPLLCICLGAELLAQATGSPARRAPEPELGWHEVQVTRAGEADPLIGPLAPHFEAFSWHSYACPLPAGAAALASSSVSLQAYRLGSRAWGLQFHAEVTLADASRWIEQYATDPDAVRAGVDPVALRAQTESRMEAWNELGRGICRRFLQVASERALN